MPRPEEEKRYLAILQLRQCQQYVSKALQHLHSQVPFSPIEQQALIQSLEDCIGAVMTGCLNSSNLDDDDDKRCPDRLMGIYTGAMPSKK
jgi:hypothetical protein